MSILISVLYVCVTMVLCVGLVKALRVDETQSIQTRVHGSRAVGLIRHQSIIAVAHPAISLDRQRNINLTYTCVKED